MFDDWSRKVGVSEGSWNQLMYYREDLHTLRITPYTAFFRSEKQKGFFMFKSFFVMLYVEVVLCIVWRYDESAELSIAPQRWKKKTTTILKDF